MQTFKSRKMENENEIAMVTVQTNEAFYQALLIIEDEKVVDYFIWSLN